MDQGTSNNRKSLLTTGAAVMVSLSSLALGGAVAATATLPIMVKLMRAIEITINTSLQFGTLAITEDAPALVTLDPLSNNLRLDTQGGIALAGGVPRAGRISVRGAPLPVSVSIETDSIRLTNGTTHLTVSNFNFNTAAGGAQITITPSGPENIASLPIGATLSMREGQLVGTYIGSNRIFANYQ